MPRPRLNSSRMLLNIVKPRGVTSRDVVNKVQRAVYPHKCGHAGTLDPIADGVLLICIDKATRLVPLLHELPKTYVGEFQWGVTSETDDLEGELEPVVNAPPLSADAIRSVLPQFTGRIEQVPPKYSAVKIQGRRAYKLARQGAEVELTPRTVSIHRLSLLGIDGDRFTLEMTCGTGTYVRSVGRDLANQLGSGAVMTALTRTSIGPFKLQDAISADALTKSKWREYTLPMSAAVPHLPSLQLGDEACFRVRRGQPLTIDPEQFPMPPVQPPQLSSEFIEVGDRDANLLAGLDASGQLIALLSERNGRLWPRTVLEPAAS